MRANPYARGLQQKLVCLVTMLDRFCPARSLNNSKASRRLPSLVQLKSDHLFDAACAKLKQAASKQLIVPLCQPYFELSTFRHTHSPCLLYQTAFIHGAWGRIRIHVLYVYTWGRIRSHCPALNLFPKHIYARTHVAFVQLCKLQNNSI